MKRKSQDRRKESGRTGEKRAVEQESFSKVAIIQPVTLAAQLVCSLFSSVSFLLLSLPLALLLSFRGSIRRTSFISEVAGLAVEKRAGLAGEKRAEEQESFSKVTIIQPVTLAAPLVCSLFSSLSSHLLSSLLFSLLSVLLTFGSPYFWLSFPGSVERISFPRLRD